MIWEKNNNSKKKINSWRFALHSLSFNVSLWFSKFTGGLLLYKLGPRLPFGRDQKWDARMPSSRCLGYQQELTISRFYRCFPEQSEAPGSRTASSAGRWCYYYYLPLTVESNQVLLCSREAAAPCRSCRSAFRQKSKRAFTQGSSNFRQKAVTEVPLSCDSLLSILNIVYSSLT